MVLWTQSNAWLQGEVSAIIRKSLFPQGTSKMWWKSRRWFPAGKIRSLSVLDNDLKNRIADECTKKFPWNTENIHEAPALIVLCTVKGLSGYEPNGEASTTKGTHWQSFDAGMAADHFCLAARAVDLGTLIMGRYDEEKIKEILDLPEEYDVSCIIAVGHPEVIPAANERKPLKEVLTFR